MAETASSLDLKLKLKTATSLTSSAQNELLRKLKCLPNSKIGYSNLLSGSESACIDGSTYNRVAFPMSGLGTKGLNVSQRSVSDFGGEAFYQFHGK